MNADSDSSNAPESVADALGLGSLGDGDAGIDPDVLRDLYRHARNDDGVRVLFNADMTFKRGWVNLDAPRAMSLVSTFVALDDADDLKAARRIAQRNLEAQPWNDVLGIQEPPIRCRIKIHGAKWGLRFESAAPALRGQELVNEQLPTIPGTRPFSAPTPTSPEPTPTAPATNEDAIVALRRAGFPA